MDQILDKRFLPGLRSLWQLTRPVPFMAWSGCAILLGVAPALANLSFDKLNDMFLIMLTAWLLQGLVAHAVNDFEDWISGTDAASPGILSGGSGVIKSGTLGLNRLKMVEKTALVAATGISLYFVRVRGPGVLLLLITGLWSSLAYSRPPFRLAYRPFLGEWFCAFPAVIAITTGTYFLLTGTITGTSLSLGILHGLFSIGWLMIHHLTDIQADLSASPRKQTTPAWLSLKAGKEAPKAAPVLYFSLAVLWAAFSSVYFSSHLLLSVPFGLISILLTLKINLNDVWSITVTELIIIGLVVMQTLLLGWCFLL